MRDVKQGIPYKLMCGFILYWIATSLLATELYLSNAFPVGVFSMWPTSSYAGSLGRYDYEEAQTAVWNATVERHRGHSNSNDKGGVGGRGGSLGLNQSDGGGGGGGGRLNHSGGGGGGGGVNRSGAEVVEEDGFAVRGGGGGVEYGTVGQYCGNPKYNAHILSDDRELDFENVTCTFNDPAEATVLGENHMLVVTAMRHEYVSFHKKMDGAAGAAVKSGCSAGGRPSHSFDLFVTVCS